MRFVHGGFAMVHSLALLSSTLLSEYTIAFKLILLLMDTGLCPGSHYYEQRCYVSNVTCVSGPARARAHVRCPPRSETVYICSTLVDWSNLYWRSSITTWPSIKPSLETVKAYLWPSHLHLGQRGLLCFCSDSHLPITSQWRHTQWGHCVCWVPGWVLRL